jgi:DNA-binding NarL/FixJ family response regulator
MVTAVRPETRPSTAVVNGVSNGRTRVLIVEDEPLFLDLLCQALTTDRTEVVGVASDGETAVRLAYELTPDVVVADIHLPGKIDGTEAGLQIKKHRPETGIVTLSAHKDRRYLTSIPMEYTNGWSYLLKQSVANMTVVIRAIEGSAIGLMALDPQITADLRPGEDCSLARLTQRQLEVLELMAQGHSNASVASTICVEEKTVENYINAIYQELQITSDGVIHQRVKATLTYLEESRSL